MKRMKFYFAGHTHFGNRGCEALIRSTVQLLREEFGEIEALVPSADAARDAAQWPDHANYGVRFVPAPGFPDVLRWWHRAIRVLPALKKFWIPRLTASRAATSPIDECDAIILTGGDVITLDYGLPSLIWNVRLVEPWIDKGKPALLWGASVGPFKADPVMERFMAGFLRKLSAITVRETISRDYLAGIGVRDNVTLVTDPAFNLKPEPCDLTFWPVDPGKGVLGFNVSPLIQKFRPQGENPDLLKGEIVGFLREVIDSQGFSVLLIPHVDPLDGSTFNSDSNYMRDIFEQLGDRASKVGMVVGSLNAAELKYVLSQVTYFIGARTHATIGAISSSVPTLSIAYSVKAKGLNRDLFETDELVVDTPTVSHRTLKDAFEMLMRKEGAIRGRLAEVLPAWKEAGGRPARLLKSMLSA
jgi:polysaccharide pyruvyl transferase WcaK-like protein